MMAQEHPKPDSQVMRELTQVSSWRSIVGIAYLYGVALAAIQGLNQKLTDELKRRDAENEELKQRLEKLERLMNQQNGGAR